MIILLAHLFVIVSLAFILFQCLKIKSSQKDSEFHGIIGTVVRKDPEDEIAPDSPSCENSGTVIRTPSRNGERKLPELPSESNSSTSLDFQDREESETLHSKDQKEHPYATLLRKEESHETLTLNEMPPIEPLPVIPNFSGDSSDSNKGYTSISVREPLKHIQSLLHKPLSPKNAIYVTMSETSDDNYAAIEEEDPKSDTYAVIGPYLEASGYSQIDSGLKNRRPVSYNPTLEEMYAKVQKRARSGPICSPPKRNNTSRVRSEDWSLVPRRDLNYADFEVSRYDGYETLSRDTNLDYETLGINNLETSELPGYETVSSDWPEDEYDKNYERVDQRNNSNSHKYSTTLNNNNNGGYEILKNNCPPYAQLLKKSPRSKSDEEEGYETIPGKDFEDHFKEPAYETITSSFSSHGNILS